MKFLAGTSRSWIAARDGDDAVATSKRSEDFRQPGGLLDSVGTASIQCPPLEIMAGWCRRCTFVDGLLINVLIISGFNQR